MVTAGDETRHARAPLVAVIARERERRALSSALSAIDGLELETYASSDELLSRLDRGDPIECIVSDADLPDGDGLSLLRAVRRYDRTVPFVLYADGDEELASDAIAAGVTEYVPKRRTNALEWVSTRVQHVLAVSTAPSDSSGSTGPVTSSDSSVDTSQTTDSSAEDSSTTDSELSTHPGGETSRSTCWGDVETMHYFALEFESCSSREAAYELAVEAAQEILGADGATLVVEDGGKLVRKATVGELLADAVREYDLDEGIVGQTYRTKASSLASDVRDVADADPIDDRLRSGISAPVGSIGVLQVGSIRPDAFDERDVQLVELLGAHVSATINRLESQRIVERERDRFVSLFENVPDPVVLINSGDSDTIFDVNPGFERTFGYERGDVVGTSINDLIIPEDEAPITVYEEVGLDEVIMAEVTRLTADGPREFLFRGFATDILGTVHEYAMYTDLTDQKRREYELEQYKTLVETVGDAMYALDDEGYIEMVNDAFVETSGYDRENVVGEHVSTFMPESDVERGTRLLLEIAEDDDRRWDTFELQIKHADGSQTIAEDNVAPITDDDGLLTGSVGVIRDITDRKTRERRIRALHDGTRRLMTAEDADEVAHVATTIAADALDLPCTGIYLYDDDANRLVPVAVSEGIRDLVGDPPTIEPDDGLAWDAYESGEPITRGDVRDADGLFHPTDVGSEAHLPLAGRGIFLISSTDPEKFDDEALALAKILAANVEAALDRAERESQLAQRTRELERQNDRLDDFAGTVSHDLRNPLTLANGHLSVLDQQVDDGLDHHVEEISWALERMDELIDDVLTLARSGRNVTETSAVELTPVVEKATRTVDPALDVRLEEPLPTIEADENRLLVLFENLFRNALEHVSEDVTITVGAFDDGFYVADDGPGIPPEEREQVFESGYTTDVEGTGFGLAIVSEVVEAHGWDLELETSDRGGAQFTIFVSDSG